MKRILFQLWHSYSTQSTVRVLIFIALCFLIGSAAGSLVAVNLSSKLTLSVLLDEIRRVESNGFLPVFLNYLKYPGIVFLFGLSLTGPILIPLTTLMRAFFLSFSITSVILGSPSGELLAPLLRFGIKSLFSLPPLFILASQGLLSSSYLFSLATGKGKKLSSGIFGTPYFGKAGISLAVLLAGALLEFYGVSAVS